MTGTIINIATILIGGTVGSLLGGRLPDRLRQTIISGLGLFTLAYGLQNFLQTKNAMVVLGSLLLGILLGEWWQIEDGLQRVGVLLEKRLTGGRTSEVNSRFIRGFMTASLVFCVGPMAIMGSLQDGLSGNYATLTIKAVLDGFGALAFASSLGVGVIASALVILVYQGGISLMAAQVQAAVTPAMMTEMTATGGVLLLGVAISSILEIKKMRVGNFLPALLIAPTIVAVLTALRR
jgi:uncharacterized membrane protein YqgA involved in biofilm formation